MADPDPDSVQVLAAQLHAVECLPGSHPNARYSQRHREVHDRRAALILTGLANAGYHLTSSRES